MKNLLFTLALLISFSSFGQQFNDWKYDEDDSYYYLSNSNGVEVKNCESVPQLMVLIQKDSSGTMMLSLIGEIYPNYNGDEIKLNVTFRTKDNTRDEVSVTGGYPYKKDASVDVTISNSNFKFQSSDNFAWLPKKDDEIKIIRQMKKKNDAKVVGISARGNKTTDTYSLLGFTDAYNSAKNKCKK